MWNTIKGGGAMNINPEKNKRAVSARGSIVILFCAAVILTILSAYYCFFGNFDSFLCFAGTKNDANPVEKYIPKEGAKMEKATFAAGCFWGVEHRFGKIKGVVKTSVGYTGGRLKDPTYEDVCYKDTGHAEAVLLEFDPAAVTYEKLMEAFFAMHDPTQLNRQGPDHGEQYRSAIFFHSAAQEAAARDYIETLKKSGNFRREIVTRIEAASVFYAAEEYHQKYLEKKGVDICH